MNEPISVPVVALVMGTCMYIVLIWSLILQAHVHTTELKSLRAQLQQSRQTSQELTPKAKKEL